MGVAEVLRRYAAPVLVLAPYRWVLPFVAGLLAAGDPAGVAGDAIRFARAGAELARGQVGAVYADPWMQAGPFEIVGSLLVLPRRDQHVAAYVSYSEHDLAGTRFVLAVVLVALLMAATRFLRRAGGLDGSPGSELLVGAAAVVSGLPDRAWLGGHLAETAIPLCWLAGSVLLARGRPVLAGAVLGVSAGWETWGVLGAGLLLVERRRGRGIRAGLALAAAAAVPYLPFVLTGHFAMFDLRWPIAPGSLVAAVWPGRAEFGWEMRLLQGALAVAAGALVTLALRRRPAEAAWLAPLAVVAVRILLDPLALPYYWTPICLVAVVGLGLRRASDPPAVLGGVFLLAYLPPLFLWPMVAWPPAYLLVTALTALTALTTVTVATTAASSRA